MRIAFKIGARNTHLHNLLVRKGWTQVRLAKELGVSPVTVGDYFRMGSFPKDDNIRARLELLLDVPFEEAFPPEIKERSFRYAKKRWIIQKDIDIDYLPFYQIPQISYDPANNYDLKDAVDKAMETLTPREKSVLTKIFGLDYKGEMTKTRIAEEEGISKSCLFQIEQKALRKLRHPSRRQFIDPSINIKSIEEGLAYAKK